MNLDEHVRKALYRAVTHRSGLDARVLKLEGMSSPKVRHFLNNVCRFDGCRYLEVGCWKGSTLLSAIYDNPDVHYWGVDNWSEWTAGGDPKLDLVRNFQEIIGAVPGDTTFIEKDFRRVNPLEHGIADVNVYFYDGSHSEEAHFHALQHFMPVLEETFIFIVDDWNEVDVQRGTDRAVAELGLHAIYHQTLPAMAKPDRDLWWNGLRIFVFRKTCGVPPVENVAPFPRMSSCGCNTGRC